MLPIFAALVVAASGTAPAQPAAVPIPQGFESHDADRAAIEQLLRTYAEAVTSKNEPLFLSILLSTDIPFSDAGSAIRSRKGGEGTRNFESFRQGVFHGAPFIQRFQDIHIDQDGPLAQVSLVFVNSAADGRSWGWKTIQLLKVAGQWKIASEFYTGHPG